MNTMKNQNNFLKITILLGIITAFAFNVKKGKPEFNSRKILFNTGWDFHLNDSIKDQDTISNTTTWRTLNLPHDWSIEGEFDEKALLVMAEVLLMED